MNMNIGQMLVVLLLSQLEIKYIDVNENERLSNFILRPKLTERNSAFLAIDRYNINAFW
jgi:hypothetical protein